MIIKQVSLALTALVLSTTLPLAAPAPRVFSSIEVEGNSRFRDLDVIASSGLPMGVPLGEQDLKAAVEALVFTGEFKDVRIVSQGETLIIRVDEEPAYTGGLSFGLGYSSDIGAIGVLDFGLTDIFGPGTQLRGTAEVAEEMQTVAFAYSSPRFWGADRSGGIRLLFKNHEHENDVFAYTNASFSPYHNFSVENRFAGELRYTLARTEISDVQSTASNILQAEAGERISSGVGFSLMTGSSLVGQDRTDRIWNIRFDQDFTGLGGDTNLSISKLSLFGKTSIGNSGFAIRSRVELGSASGWNGYQPIATDRFFLGGASLRGFEVGTISPRDVCAGCGADGADVVTNLGGNNYAVARTDLLLPTFKNLGNLETFVFGDIGSSWAISSPASPSGDLSANNISRSSAGIGVSLATELGTFEGYYALAVEGAKYDQEQLFGLAFRSEF